MAGSDTNPKPETAPTEQESVPVDRRHPPLSVVLSRFHLSIDAVRDMTGDFLPHVRRQERERFGPEAMAKVRSLEPDQQERLRGLLDSYVQETRLGNGAPNHEELSQILGPEVRSVFEGDQHSLVSFILNISKALAGPDRVVMIHNSLLAQAVSAFEVLVSGVAARYFLTFPKALESPEKEFSLSDLREFRDVNDATDFLLAKQVSRLMYGSLDDWADWFRGHCKVDLRKLALDWSVLNESIQRRHVILHNGGQVSRQYLSRVPDAAARDVKVGTELPIDEDYLRRTFDEIDVLGTLLVVMAWGTWQPDDRDHSAGALLQRSYELMLHERWEAVEALTKVGCELKCSAAVKEPFKVNGWHSRAQIVGNEAVYQEVLEWDVTASAGRFRLARLVLLGDLAEAATLAEELLATDELSRGQLKEWPILARLREHGVLSGDQLGTQD